MALAVVADSGWALPVAPDLYLQLSLESWAQQGLCSQGQEYKQGAGSQGRQMGRPKPHSEVVVELELVG